MRRVGLACGAHDTAYSIMEDGKTLVHEELERFSRIKEQQGDVLKFFFDRNPDIGKVDYFTHFVMRWRGGLHNQFPESFQKMKKHLSEHGGRYIEISHHKAHAANAFFSSNFKDAIIITMDGGGEEDESGNYSTTCFTIYEGKDNQIKLLKQFPFQVNIGGFWSAITKETFGYSSGPPKGNQCGTVMAMAAYAKDPKKYLPQMNQLLRNSDYSSFSAWAPLPFDEKINIAAALQKATELYVFELIAPYVARSAASNVCLAGGVALNSALTGKMYDWFDEKIKNIYVCPVPYDAGLAIGASQYVWHCIENRPRIYSGTNFTPFLGKSYSFKEVQQAILHNELSVEKCDDAEVLRRLKNKKII
mgnify:FL=1